MFAPSTALTTDWLSQGPATARKDDARRNILYGTLLLGTVSSGAFAARTLTPWLDKAMTGKDDRDPFGLRATGAASSTSW